jgi:triosephosphate isomerase
MKNIMKLPAVVVNFKTFESSTGQKAFELAQICDRVAKETGKGVAICVQAADIYRITNTVSIPVFSEHVDPEDFGAFTGKIIVDDIKDNGADGSLLNHSEDRYRIDVLEKAIEKLRVAELLSIACANNDSSASAIAAFNPDMIAVEPPELIGGNVSVTSANPDIIKKSVAAVKLIGDIPVLCGAGVKSGSDVRAAVSFGCSGVLVATGVTKAKDPYLALKDLVDGL